MFNSISMTGSGMLVLAVLWLGQWAGLVNFDQTQAAAIVKDALELIGYGLAIVGQLRRTDLSMGFWRIQQ
jgi:hypothetical protein